MNHDDDHDVLQYSTVVVAHDCEGVENPDDQSPVPSTRLLSVRIDFPMRAFGGLHDRLSSCRLEGLYNASSLCRAPTERCRAPDEFQPRFGRRSPVPYRTAT